MTSSRLVFVTNSSSWASRTNDVITTSWLSLQLGWKRRGFNRPPDLWTSLPVQGVMFLRRDAVADFFSACDVDSERRKLRGPVEYHRRGGETFEWTETLLEEHWFLVGLVQPGASWLVFLFQGTNNACLCWVSPNISPVDSGDLWSLNKVFLPY